MMTINQAVEFTDELLKVLYGVSDEDLEFIKAIISTMSEDEKEMYIALATADWSKYEKNI